MLKDVLKSYERDSIVISVLFAILGVFLVVNPTKSITSIIFAFGVLLLGSGIISILNYCLIPPEEKIYSLDFLRGVLTIIAGLLTIIFKDDLVNVLPILLGLFIIFNHLFKMQMTFNFSSILMGNSVWFIILEILWIVLGVLLILNPFEGLVTIGSLAGILLIISEIGNIISSIVILRKIKKY